MRLKELGDRQIWLNNHYTPPGFYIKYVEVYDKRFLVDNAGNSLALAEDACLYIDYIPTNNARRRNTKLTSLEARGSQRWPKDKPAEPDLANQIDPGITKHGQYQAELQIIGSDQLRKNGVKAIKATSGATPDLKIRDFICLIPHSDKPEIVTIFWRDEDGQIKKSTFDQSLGKNLRYVF